MFFESLIYSAENFYDAFARRACPEEKSHTKLFCDLESRGYLHNDIVVFYTD